MRLRVEPKPDMRMRIGKSPDEADAALLLVVLAKERHGFGASREKELGLPGGVGFKAMFSRLGSVNRFRTL
jgi:hypothetical protein